MTVRVLATALSYENCIFLVLGAAILKEVQLFEVFSDQVSSIISNRQYLPPEDMVALQVALINLALKCYPDRIDYIDKVMLSSVEVKHKKVRIC